MFHLKDYRWYCHNQFGFIEQIVPDTQNGALFIVRFVYSLCVIQVLKRYLGDRYPREDMISTVRVGVEELYLQAYLAPYMRLE